MIKKIFISIAVSLMILFGLYNLEFFISKNNTASYMKNENISSLNGEDKFNQVTTVIDDLGLKKENKDYVGWLNIEGSNINTPVMKSDFYFRKNIKKRYSLAGTPFIPKYNPQKNIKTVFGHNLGYGRKDAFHDITEYSKKEFYDTHQTVYFTENNLKGNKYKVVAYLNYSTKNSFNYLNTTFRNVEEFDDWKENIKKYSKYSDKNFENILYDKGKILILSTCHSTTWTDDGIRSVLICYCPERLSNINVDYYNISDL
ncbi:MAG: class B sortase [Finegoldia magna]|nr:class B sortase [Finegoldia magna]